MRILLTGASGFIGQHATLSLLEAGHDLTVIARSKKTIESFSWANSVSFIRHDIHHSGRLHIQHLAPFDALMHLAWQGLPHYHALHHIEHSTLKHYCFIRDLVTQGITKVLVTGTCMEYGLQEGCLHEDMPAQPMTSYALAKHTLHQFLTCLQKEHPFQLQWTRLFYTYGTGQHPKSILAQLDHALRQQDKSFNMSAGEQLRDYLPVEDVTKKIAKLIACHQSGVFNICRGEPISIRRLVEEHLQKCGKKIALNLGYYPYPNYEPMAFWGNTQKTTQVLSQS